MPIGTGVLVCQKKLGPSEVDGYAIWDGAQKAGEDFRAAQAEWDGLLESGPGQHAVVWLEYLQWRRTMSDTFHFEEVIQEHANAMQVRPMTSVFMLAIEPKSHRAQVIGRNGQEHSLLSVAKDCVNRCRC